MKPINLRIITRSFLTRSHLSTNAPSPPSQWSSLSSIIYTYPAIYRWSVMLHHLSNTFLAKYKLPAQYSHRWSEIARKPRLCFRYPDMTIHTSRGALLEFLQSVRKNQPAVICTNVDIRLDHIFLGKGARRMLRSSNAGGSSLLSEALSIELLGRLFGMDLVKTETELVYRYSGPITDYAGRLPRLVATAANTNTLGVSVTRAVAYKRRYTKEDATHLLKRKLQGILQSNENIAFPKFNKQILHVWTESGANAELVQRVCKKLSNDLRGNTIVLITTVNASSVFFNNNSHLSFMNKP
ncbi:hypothetical protein EC973_001647 [Apophysomyces ossiformis]|uniref:Uncharacterized protein n=1 Tax=Apophysomyces ossiformis TaxID=679940 RepID=A0A8H7BXY0_9FUNG|nr:hypothetical protein EC973_001647 [Apophysomyces ossiformis]